MIGKRINSRKDGKSSPEQFMRYAQGLKLDRETGLPCDRSHRTRFGNFKLVDDAVFYNLSGAAASELIRLASTEMQCNCDLNTRVAEENKTAHFVFSFDQQRPPEAVLLDLEASILESLQLSENHFCSFVHNDSGHWHIHLYVSRIESNGSHRGNSLWQDRTIRDKVCREIELRHNLKMDNGLHVVNENGEIVKVGREARRQRQADAPAVSQAAMKLEVKSGEKSFQSLVNERRIGDYLKGCTSWQELHISAAKYSFLVKQKGAGFVLCSSDGRGAVQLSRIGLKNLQAKFGPFQPCTSTVAQPSGVGFRVASIQDDSNLFDRFKGEQLAHRTSKKEALDKLQNDSAERFKSLRGVQKSEIIAIRALSPKAEVGKVVSVTKMRHAIDTLGLKRMIAAERLSIYAEYKSKSPGNNFREYLLRQARKGDEKALNLVRRIGERDTTMVLSEREESQLLMKCNISGEMNYPINKISFIHEVASNGTVTFNLGDDRQLVDSAICRKIFLNNAASLDEDAIEIALTFAAARFGKQLVLSGTPIFQHLAVEISVKRGIPVEFSDPILEEYRRTFKQSYFRKEVKNVINFGKHDGEKAGREKPVQQLQARDVVPELDHVAVHLPRNGTKDLGGPSDELHRTVRQVREIDPSAGDPVNGFVTEKACLEEKIVQAIKNGRSDRQASNATHDVSAARRRRRTTISNKPEKGR